MTSTAAPLAGAQTLRDHGLHVTPQRLAVLEAVTSHQHSTADAVLDLVRSRIGSISRQAVYDCLSALVGAGILRRIEPAGSPARYETRVGDNHHHVACRTCGALADVDCAIGDAPCLTAASDQGFVIDEAEVVYWGTCPQCTEQLDTTG